MFKKLIGRITGPETENGFDPTSLHDPVALLTSWDPASPGGSNFATHTLHMIHPQRAEFRCSVGMKLMSGIFLVFGTVIAGVFGRPLLAGQFPTETDQLVPLGIGVVFALIGAFLLRNALTPIVFDLGHGYFCRDRRKPEHTMDPSRIKHHARLDDVHALQLVSEICRTKNGSYLSHELNLVLRDGKRIHVVDHGDLARLRNDARRIAELIRKPLWDAC